MRDFKALCATPYEQEYSDYNRYSYRQQPLNTLSQSFFYVVKKKTSTIIQYINYFQAIQLDQVI